MVLPAQPRILEGVPAVARYVTFNAVADADRAALGAALQRLAQAADGRAIVVGIGPSLVAVLGASVPGLREFPHLSGNGVKVPSTPLQLWCWLRGDDLGFLLHAMRKLQKLLAPAFRTGHVLDAFRHALGESGSHVKRAAQESFDPPAFMLRRSMPWLLSTQAGLMFVAFGRSHDAFEAQLRRMAGEEDGVVDAMFRISRPVNGASLWCPPVQGGRLDLRRLGL